MYQNFTPLSLFFLLFHLESLVSKAGTLPQSCAAYILYSVFMAKYYPPVLK